MNISCNARNSRSEVFCKKDVHRNFTTFAGEHLCQRLFFNKVTGLRPATLLKDTLAQVLSCEFCEISKSTFLHRTSLMAASVLRFPKFNHRNFALIDAKLAEHGKGNVYNGKKPYKKANLSKI